VSIPFNQLWTTREDAREPLAAAIDRVLRSGRYILGAEVEAFENEFSAYLGVCGGTGVASGTDALTLALMAGGLEPGAEVLLPAFGPGATITGILAAGATPVPVDVEWDFTLNQTQLKEALTPRTRALVAVHLYGRPERIIALRQFAQTHSLWLVEDCAQAHGAEVWDPEEGGWKKTGTFGDASAFSFYPTKNLGALGDAGFCVARTAAGTETLRRLRQYGWKRRDKATQVGRNSRMDELQAAVLRIGLPLLEDWNARRRALVQAYDTLLEGRPEVRPAKRPEWNAQSRSACHLQVLRVGRRNALRRHLAAHGVGTGVHYPLAHAQQKAFSPYARAGGYPVAERLAREVLSLPLHPFLHETEVERTVGCLFDFWNSL
jgi:dTDP-3-amino-3,4,6-trideoxy-alpha-D-glucose transaminase